MRGRRTYAFEIAVRGSGGEWLSAVTRSGPFTRGPKATDASVRIRILGQTGRQLAAAYVVADRGSLGVGRGRSLPPAVALAGGERG